MRHLGPYQLLRKIGSGGMAEVWSARRPAAANIGADKFVAIKVLAPHLAQKQQYRDMFLAEARLSMLLSHSNIVQVFDVIEEADECYMVMELIEGMTLSQLERGLGKQGRKLPIDVSAYVVAELLRALAYAHEVKTPAGSTIVHRDVSPQNLMVTTSGEIKLMDFGIARFATEETQGAFVKGKLQYMPPEQLKKETRKPTIDLFAVGGILHELIDGRPFRAKIEETRLLGMVLQGEVPDLSCDLDEVPTELDLLRMWLLEPEEADRLQSATDALEQLYKWPGYGNASIGLKKLVQEFVEPSSAFAIPQEILEEEGSFSGVPVPSASQLGAAVSQVGAAASQTGAAASQTGAAASQAGAAASQTGATASQTGATASQTGAADSQTGPAASQTGAETDDDLSASASASVDTAQTIASG
ncbi:MAG: serine/threonine protein kinase, partial [Myxococcales bacterium]|nr:serine/threonine protein kinase [Myxococcales bacterium]